MPHEVLHSAHIFTDCEFVQSTYLSSIPETILQHLSQHPEELSAAGFTQSVLSSSNLVEELSAETMEDKEPKPSDPSLSDAPLDRYGQLPGSTPTEKIRNAWAKLSEENQSELSQTANAVGTPSSVGDIEASIPVSVPETTAPLSVRADTDSFSHSHTAVHHGHSEPLLPPSELAHGGHMGQPSLQTIHPSALTVTGMDEVVTPGSVHLGPSEFAVTLPMDSRVKDDYERVLSDAATSIRQFFDSFQPSTQISEPEVSGESFLNMIRIAYILCTARGFAFKYAGGHHAAEQCFNPSRFEHIRPFERRRPRPCERGILGRIL